jgi:hypothetical protein
VKSGLAPFSIPVSADDTRSSAWGNMLKGKASQSTPRSATQPHSLAGMLCQERGRRARVAKPIRIRRKVIPFGPTDSSASAMNRNEAPQMIPGATIRNQS